MWVLKILIHEKQSFLYIRNSNQTPVIVAGYGKTGTKSIAAALKQLGLVVYDLEEHMCIHHQEWWRILKAEDDEACSPSIFKKMYEHVDVAIDTPVYIFWEQISQAFPDAKIIFMTRPEEKWAASLKNHFDRERTHNKAGWFLHNS